MKTLRILLTALALSMGTLIGVAHSATPAKGGANAVIPIKLPVSPVGPITFANAVENVAQIPTQAFNNVKAAINSGAKISTPVTIDLGSKTNADKATILAAIKRELSEFSGFNTPKAYYAITYSAADEKWAEKEWATVAKKNGVSQGEIQGRTNNIRGNCNIEKGVATECYGGMAFSTNGTEVRWVFYGVGNDDSWTAKPSDYGNSTQVNHEFTHILQTAQYNGHPIAKGDNIITDTQHRGYPCWVNEGQANALGISTWIPDLQNYLTVRNRTATTPGPIRNGEKLPIADFSAASLTKFLTTQAPFTGPNTPGCYQPGTGTYSLGYNVGFSAMEALIAIAGPQPTMALIARTALGDDFGKAFQTVYGISWAQGSTILGNVLAAEYAANPIQSN